MKPKKETFDTIQSSRILIVGIQTPLNTNKTVESYFEEFRNLVKSNGILYSQEMYIKLRSIDPTYFLTKGKLEELTTFCEENDIEEIILSEPVTNKQHRNLSKILHAKIYDRTELILEIFEKGAQSAEGKLQVEIAMLEHKKTRVVGGGIELAQQAGLLGGRGPGETQKEKELRHFETLISTLNKHLKQLEKVRDTQRKQRLSQCIPQVALIGYTNAGKSTILNILTNSTVLAEDKLFATLDTTTRELFLNGKKKGLISDTVGFIQQLPTKLINAFKSTLSELAYADLLLHVIDASDPNWRRHVAVVHEILRELDVYKPMLYVFNKIDRLSAADVTLLEMTAEKYLPHVLVSSLTKDGIEPLKKWLIEWDPKSLQYITPEPDYDDAIGADAEKRLDIHAPDVEELSSEDIADDRLNNDEKISEDENDDFEEF